MSRSAIRLLCGFVAVLAFAGVVAMLTTAPRWPVSAGSSRDLVCAPVLYLPSYIGAEDPIDRMEGSQEPASGGSCDRLRDRRLAWALLVTMPTAVIGGLVFALREERRERIVEYDLGDY